MPAKPRGTVNDPSVTEGKFDDGKWVAGRRLNGDENDQGNYWRFDPGRVGIEKAVLYRFE